MATANQLISDALLLLERPDLENLCRAQTRRVVLEAHARQEFSRDRASFDTAILTTDDGVKAVTYPVGFRKLDFIEMLDIDSNTIPALFLERSGATLLDYAHFKEPNNYFRRRNGMDVKWKLCAQPTMMRTHYYGFPSWVETTGEGGVISVECDSWILSEFDGCILYKVLAFLGAAVGRADDTRLWASLAQEATDQLLANYGDA